MSFRAGILPDQQITDEFRRVEQAFNDPQEFAYLRELHDEPIRPRVGMVARADGTNWDPGSGAGATMPSLYVSL